VGPRSSLDTEAREKILSLLPGIEPRPPGRPARSQTILTELVGSLLVFLIVIIQAVLTMSTKSISIPRKICTDKDVSSRLQHCLDEQFTTQGTNMCRKCRKRVLDIVDCVRYI
jgi:hypothetical protein